MLLRELKEKVTVGTKLTRVRATGYAPGAQVHSRLTVVKANTVGFWVQTESGAKSWMDWPRKGEFKELPFGFEVMSLCGRFTNEYRWGWDEEAEA